jgi:dihydrosphingosine 1-phosphate phosphatase
MRPLGEGQSPPIKPLMVCHLIDATSIVHILALGVFLSGFLKDLCCLPRPLSPPLQRITMSGSAALEYGFPSTHSTNAVSVAVYALYLLESNNSISTKTKVSLQLLSYLYAFSIVLGRLYCGMHGFLDVFVGSLLGAGITLIQCVYGNSADAFIRAATPNEILIIVLIVLVLVRIHPEPADDCPCFDDSVSFAGVVIGVEAGGWHLAGLVRTWTPPGSSDQRSMDVGSMNWSVMVGRIVVGVLVIFLWRGTMKSFMLRILPPIFRVTERLGLTLPRKFFKRASEYQDVPKSQQDDDLWPGITKIPSLFSSIGRPRKRAVSIGPQSPADVYETLAYREKRRRESVSAAESAKPEVQEACLGRNVGESESTACSRSDSVSNDPTFRHGRKMSKLRTYESMMGTGFDPGTNDEAVESPIIEPLPSDSHDSMRDQQGDEMLSRLEKGRVRYDVEVVTKLIVYAGEFMYMVGKSISSRILIRAFIFRYRVAGRRRELDFV